MNKKKTNKSNFEDASFELKMGINEENLTCYVHWCFELNRIKHWFVRSEFLLCHFKWDETFGREVSGNHMKIGYGNLSKKAIKMEKKIGFSYEILLTYWNAYDIVSQVWLLLLRKMSNIWAENATSKQRMKHQQKSEEKKNESPLNIFSEFRLRCVHSFESKCIFATAR